MKPVESMFSRSHLLPLFWFVCSVLLIALSGCATEAEKYAKQIAKERLEDPEFWARYDRREELSKAQYKEVSYVGITCVPHDVSIDLWYAEEVPHGQYYSRKFGGSMSCGGVTGASYPLPKQWVPGMRVLVRWSTVERNRKPWFASPPPESQTTYAVQWHETYATILPYTKVGNVWVHIFPNDEVRIVVSNIGASGEDHPIGFDDTTPPPQDPSHVPIPITGVNLDCVPHGGVPVAINTDIEIENPNFTNPVRTELSLNTKYLRVDQDYDPLGRDFIKGCRETNSLQVDNVWQPGKKVKVSWAREPTPEEAAKKQRPGYTGVFLNVAVPRYDKPKSAWLHLFPGDQARLVFSDESPDSPKHPIPRDALVPPPEGE